MACGTWQETSIAKHSANPSWPRIPIHDNNLYRYEFDARTSTLVLRTHYQEGGVISEYTDVWFLDVWCHHIEGILGHDILFGIDEWGLDHELESFGDLFDRLKNQVGWPPVNWNKETIHEAVSRMNLRVWHFDSSYGTQGFVIGREMRIQQDAGEASRLTPPTAEQLRTDVQATKLSR